MCAVYQNQLTLLNVTTLTVFRIRFKLYLKLPIMKCYFIPLLHPVSCIHIFSPESHLHSILHWILNYDWHQWLNKIMCWELWCSSWNSRFIFGITWVQISARIPANLSEDICDFTQALEANSETNLFTMLIARLALSKHLQLKHRKQLHL